RRDCLWSHGAKQTFREVVAQRALGQLGVAEVLGVLDRIADFNPANLRLFVAAVRHQRAALLVDVALTVAHNQAMVFHHQRASVSQMASPLQRDCCLERRVGQRRNRDAVNHLLCTAVGRVYWVVWSLCLDEQACGEKASSNCQDRTSGHKPPRAGLILPEKLLKCICARITAMIGYVRAYSYRSATMGSTFIARLAGK